FAMSGTAGRPAPSGVGVGSGGVGSPGCVIDSTDGPVYSAMIWSYAERGASRPVTAFVSTRSGVTDSTTRLDVGVWFTCPGRCDAGSSARARSAGLKVSPWPGCAAGWVGWAAACADAAEGSVAVPGSWGSAACGPSGLTSNGWAITPRRGEEPIAYGCPDWSCVVPKNCGSTDPAPM